MKKLVEFPLESGGTVIVEVNEPSEEGTIERVARFGEVSARANKSLEATLEQITPAAEAILKRFTGLSQLPDEIEVEFGLKLNAEVGAFVASGSIEANYVIKLKWVREKTVQP